MRQLIDRLAAATGRTTAPLNRYGAPVADLLARLWIGLVFFRSGLQKIADWESTLFLFQYEYALPILPYTAAAYASTFFELVMPVLLFAGLFARLAALPLLGMAMTIQFYMGAQNAAYNSFEHYAWMVLLLMIITRGPGPLSADHALKRLIAGSTPETSAG